MNYAVKLVCKQTKTNVRLGKDYPVFALYNCAAVKRITFQSSAKQSTSKHQSTILLLSNERTTTL